MTANQTETGAAPEALSPEPQAASTARPVLDIPDFKQMKKKKRLRKYIIAVLVIAVIAGGVYYVSQRFGGVPGAATAAVVTAPAEARDIVVSIGGSSAVKAANSYIVTTLISGEILSSPFEEGDIVNKDDVLYIVDSSDIATSIERAELTFSQSQNSLGRKLESLEDLAINAKEAGTLISLLVKEGDSVSPGQAVAHVRDSSVMTLTVPFGSLDAQQLYIGQAASVTLDGSYETISGVITEISRIDQTLSGNVLVRDVKIDVPNPGGITPEHTAMAEAGGIVCNLSGSFAYKSDYTLSATLSGKIARLHASEGDDIRAESTVVTLESQSLELEIENAQNSLRDAELNLDSQRDKLDSYTIKSPISGTIIEKNYKLGDTLEAGRALCTIFDLSWLELTLNIDELDIYMIEVGQEVEITASAAPGKQFKGVVTKVNINGTVSGGVTSYPVTIRIDSIDGLLPGMNVDATIFVRRLQNVLAIPSGAVQRGNRVLVQRDPAAVYAPPANTGEAPAGFEYVAVELGESDGDFVQVLSGLEEGDIVIVSSDRPQSQSLFEQFGTPGGGMVQSNNVVIVEGRP